LGEEKLLEFFGLVGKLKETKRTGWINRKIPNAESVADHCFRMAIIAMLLAKKAKVNQNRAVKMAIVHDLAEAITGDIPRDRIDDYGNSVGIKPNYSDKQKHEAEEKALLEMVKLLDKKNSKEIISLGKEYKQRKTKLSCFVKELDRLELMLQALEYKKQFPENKTIDDFLVYQKKFFCIQNKKTEKLMEKIIKGFSETK
jgi:putative hydrolase of HD superfamily